MDVKPRDIDFFLNSLLKPHKNVFNSISAVLMVTGYNKILFYKSTLTDKYMKKVSTSEGEKKFLIHVIAYLNDQLNQFHTSQREDEIIRYVLRRYTLEFA